jgi:penicillin-binding protein 1C
VGIVQAASLFFDLVRLVIAQPSTNQARGLASAQIMDNVQSQAAGLKLVKSQACADTGDIDNLYCPVKTPVWLIPGVSPIKQTGIYRNVLINRETGKLACRFVANQTDYRVVQFWPSEITQVFAQAGITKPLPLEWDPGCRAAALSMRSNQPRIVSPARFVRYKMRQGADNRLPLKAAVDGNARAVFWVVDDAVIARAAPNDPVWLPLTPGTHRVRLIDDAGNADSSLLVVE